MKHLNPDQLRHYHFKLLAKSATAKATAHLESCAECRAELERIKRQFAALDLLQEQPGASTKTLTAVLQPHASAMRPDAPSTFWKPALAIAASLAVVFGILRITNQPGADRIADGSPKNRNEGGASALKAESLPSPNDSITGGSPSPRIADNSTALKAGSPILQPDHLADGASAPRAAGIQSAAESRQDAGKTLAALRAATPFAPASNIELNVLPRRDEVQLTIYNEEDLTLVREKRKLVLKHGWNWLQFMWSHTLIDPTSLELEPKTHADQIEITQLVFPPRLNELARWTLFSEFGGEAEFELTYFTSGLKWNAFYEATLTPDEQSMELKSYVRVDNASGEDYENAQTRMVVGKINVLDPIAELAKSSHPYGYPSEETVCGCCVDYEDESNFQKEVFKQTLSEYQLYTIEGRETIPSGWGKRLPSFTAQQIGVTNLYKFDEERWGEQTWRFLSFANTEAHQLGVTPLPSGTVRVFGEDATPSRVTAERETKPNEAGSLVYIGAANLQYIPVGEEVELELGPAHKVKVEPKIMRSGEHNIQFDHEGDISGWDEITNWKIEITNTRDLPVEIEITRATESWDWSIKTEAPFEKYDGTHLRFNVRMEPQSKQTFEYELTEHYELEKETSMSTESNN